MPTSQDTVMKSVPHNDGYDLCHSKAMALAMTLWCECQVAENRGGTKRQTCLLTNCGNVVLIWFIRVVE